MDKILKIDEKELAKYLEVWFKEQIKENTDKPNFWNRNPVAKVIKNYLQIDRRWRFRKEKIRVPMGYNPFKQVKPLEKVIEGDR